MGELDRIHLEYEDRKRRLAGSDIYSHFNPSYLFMIQERQRAVLDSLKRAGFLALPNLKMLEIGCGGGRVLAEYLSLGVPSSHMYGVDLLPDRLADAHNWLPGSGFANADGQYLPFPAQSFDLVIQYTAISSILDPDIRRNVCADMLRVVKPGGLILSYDFWLNPANPQTRGLRPSEIRRLFPGCRFTFDRITLAPPIARRLVRVSWLFCAFLEKVRIFNTHYLVSIRPV